MFVSELEMIYFIQGPVSGNNKQNAIVLTWWFDLYNVMQWLEVQRCSVCKSSTSTGEKKKNLLTTTSWPCTVRHFLHHLFLHWHIRLYFSTHLLYSTDFRTQTRSAHSCFVPTFPRTLTDIKTENASCITQPQTVLQWYEGYKSFRAWCCLWKRLETLI